jgi:integrase
VRPSTPWLSPTACDCIFLLQPAPGLLERHARHGTAHASLIAEILGLLAEEKARAAVHRTTAAAHAAERKRDPGPAYLPTNLSATEIATELHVSRNTIRTHMSHLYVKLGIHSRIEAVDRTLRHAFITAALDAGVPLRDVQEAASHADPRTTMRYDRARGSLDRHATYIVAAYVAGAAR